MAWTLDNLVYYNKTIAKNHRIGLTLLQSASKYHYENGNIKSNVASADELWWNTSSLSKPLQYIDASMVGRLGKEASASIGLVASSTWLFNGLRMRH